MVQPLGRSHGAAGSSRQHNRTAVSYTHLDVYKRQKLPHELFANHPDLNWENSAVFEELLAAAKDLAQVKLTAREVSTHED